MAEKQSSSALSTWDPFNEPDFFPRWAPFWGASALGTHGEPRVARWAPSLDIFEDDERFTITVELAGTKKNDVTVEVHDNMLTLRGEKRNEREEKNEQRCYVERTYGSFSRSFSLPANADGDHVSASFADGVLTIEVPKQEEAKTRTIAVT